MDVVAVDGDEDRLLRLAAAVEADSEHPLARAIVAEARARADGDLPQANDFQSMTGRGVQARVEGATVAVGGPALLRQLELAEPEVLADQVGVWKQRGATVLYVVREDKVVGGPLTGGRGPARVPRGRRAAAQAGQAGGR